MIAIEPGVRAKPGDNASTTSMSSTQNPQSPECEFVQNDGQYPATTNGPKVRHGNINDDAISQLNRRGRANEQCSQRRGLFEITPDIRPRDFRLLTINGQTEDVRFLSGS